MTTTIVITCIVAYWFFRATFRRYSEKELDDVTDEIGHGLYDE